MIRVFAQLLRKEFLQLVRTPVLIGLLLVCPCITIGLIPFGFENKVSLPIAVVDDSHSDRGRETLVRLDASPQITASLVPSISDARSLLDVGEIDAIVVIPGDGGLPELIIDACHVLHAQDAAYYIGPQLGDMDLKGTDGIRIHRLFAGGADSTHYYIVTMLIILMTVVGCCLTGLSVINEKDSRMLEHLRSVGLSAGMYIFSKIIFYLLLALVELAFGLLIARIVFDFRVMGPLPDFFALAACFLFVISSLGVVIAVYGKTLLQVIYVMVFLFIILMLLSTMFVPMDDMPDGWAATRYANPFFWMVDGSWKVALRGFGIRDIPLNYLALLTIGGMLSAASIFRLSKNQDLS